MSLRLLTMALLSVVALGCQSGGTIDKKQLAMSQEEISFPDAKEMQRRCLEQIPPGTPIDQAEDLMTSNGFVCQRKMDETGPYLYCDMQKTSSSTTPKRWQVTIRPKKGVVEDIVVVAAPTRQ